METPIIVANWKMQLPFNDALVFTQTYAGQLATYAEKSKRTVILCPSFEALYPIGKIIENYPTITLGAQDCSLYENGPHTGQVSALSLAQLGCTFCIIGHSESRIEHGQTNAHIAAKALRLIQHGITPILCIGETAHEHSKKLIYQVLENQLSPVLEKLSTLPTINHTLAIAYEPIWAIGTGKVPEISYLIDIFSWLNKYVNQKGLSRFFLYGGSVNEDTAAALLDIPYNDGLLVGGASLDFQKFKNIVS